MARPRRLDGLSHITKFKKKKMRDEVCFWKERNGKEEGRPGDWGAVSVRSGQISSSSIHTMHDRVSRFTCTHIPHLDTKKSSLSLPLWLVRVDKQLWGF